MMRLAKRAVLAALITLVAGFVGMAQTLRLENDPRNLAPTVGTGGPIGGPTGLFTVYDAQTLRAGEFTFSAAYSNYDRDPGNVDIDEVPVSFQVGLNDYVEVFFNTDAYRSMKVNSPRNLSGFSLPNSAVTINGVRTSAPAIVLAPNGARFTTNFRPAGQQPFVQFPFIGGNFPGGFFLGPARESGSGNGADLFPGIGAPVGGILPGLVLTTGTEAGVGGVTVPVSFTTNPSYLPDAPLLNRTFGESSFNTFTFGGKVRLTSPNGPLGVALIPFYRFYADRPNDFSGFNQLQRGASPGGSRGDFGLYLAGDARLARYLNLSGNVGYIYNSSIKSGDFTLLDRPDELQGAIGLDVPVNKYFQIIGEVRATRYVGGRTPNAFEQNPTDLLGGIRVFPTRYISIGGAYRYNVNQQDEDIFDDNSGTVTVGGSTFQRFGPNGVPAGFVTSDDPNGFIFQLTAGRRNARDPGTVPNQSPTINSVDLGVTEVFLPCPPGSRSASGQCPESTAPVNVRVNATDPEGDTLLYNYTVSGGRVVGEGAAVSLDLAGVQPGTYTLSITVDDGCGLCNAATQTTTREIRVSNCPDCVPDRVQAPCPENLTVTASPKLVNVGEIITYTANFTSNGTNPTFNWTTTGGGEIVEGQGTPTIRVRAPQGSQGATIVGTATLGNVDPTCGNLTASDSADVERAPAVARQIDEYGVEPANRSKARLDNLAVELQNDPNARATIITYGNGRNPDRVAQRRADFARNYLINQRGVDAGRINTVNAGRAPDNQPRTQLYVVPAGAAEPTPNQQ